MGVGLGGEIVGGPEASGTTRRERQRRQEREGELASAAPIEALQASGSKRAGKQASRDGASERRWGERGEEGEGGGASHSEEGGASERLQASKRGGGGGGASDGGAPHCRPSLETHKEGKPSSGSWSCVGGSLR